MSLVERLNTAHRRFRADIARRAVPDEGIDLRRHTIPIAHIEEVQEVPVIVPLVVVMQPRVDLPIPTSIENKATIIIRIVAAIYDTKPEELCSSKRTLDLVRVRHLAMYVVRDITRRSFPEIGRRFGGRNHVTALNAFNKIQKLRAENPVIDAEVTALLESVRQRLS